MVGSAGAGGSCRWRAIPDEVLRIGLESMDLQNPAQLVTAGGEAWRSCSLSGAFLQIQAGSFLQATAQPLRWMDGEETPGQHREAVGRTWRSSPQVGVLSSTEMTITTWTVEVEILF